MGTDRLDARAVLRSAGTGCVSVGTVAEPDWLAAATEPLICAPEAVLGIVGVVGGVLTIAIVLAPVDPLLLATNIGGMFGGRCGFSDGGFHVVGDNWTLYGVRIICLSRP